MPDEGFSKNECKIENVFKIYWLSIYCENCGCETLGYINLDFKNELSQNIDKRVRLP